MINAVLLKSGIHDIISLPRRDGPKIVRNFSRDSSQILRSTELCSLLSVRGSSTGQVLYSVIDKTLDVKCYPSPSKVPVRFYVPQDCKLLGLGSSGRESQALKDPLTRRLNMRM